MQDFIKDLVERSGQVVLRGVIGEEWNLEALHVHKENAEKCEAAQSVKQRVAIL